MSPTAVPCFAAHSSAVSAGRDVAPEPVGAAGGEDAGAGGEDAAASAGVGSGAGASGGGATAGGSVGMGVEPAHAVPSANVKDEATNDRRAFCMVVAFREGGAMPCPRARVAPSLAPNGVRYKRGQNSAGRLAATHVKVRPAS